MTATPRATPRHWFGLAIMVVPLFMLATDLTVLYLAMPAIAADLAPQGAQSLWILHIGEFLTAATIITFGLLTRRVGARRLLLAAVAVYGAASVLAAFAPDPGTLIGARALLGVAAAAFVPTGLVLIRATFRDPRQYSVAFAVFMAAFAGGAAAGPVLGGLVLEWFWWGGVFLLNVPVALVLLVGGPLLLPRNHRDPTVRIDPVSVVLSIAAVLALVYGLQETADAGPSALPALSGALGLGLAWLFVRRQRTAPAPLLDLALFRSRQFSVMVVVLLGGSLGMAVADMLLTQHLQIVRGLGPLDVGLLLLAPALAGTLGTAATPLLTRWASPALSSAAVLAVAGVTAFAVAALLPGGGLLALAVALVVLQLFAAPFFTLVSQQIIDGAPEEHTGSATAVQEVASGLGNASSIALLGAGTLGIYRRVLDGAAPAGLDPADVEAAGESFGGSLAVVARLGGDEATGLAAAVDTAFTTATQAGFVAYGVVTLGLALAIPLLRRYIGGRPLRA